MLTMFAAVLGRVFRKEVAYVNNFVHLKIQTGSKQSILPKNFFAKLFVSSDYQRRSHLVGRAHQIAPPLTPAPQLSQALLFLNGCTIIHSCLLT